MSRLAVVLTAVLMTGALVLPAGASAQDDGVVTVEGSGIRVEVSRSPFGLRILDAHGREVLTTVANERPAPYPRAAIERPPGGGETTEQEPLHAPVTFTVGEQPVIQYPAGFWVTDIMTGASAGVDHALLEVTESEHLDHGGVRLVVTTNDPSGRTATVVISPQGDGIVGVDVGFDDDAGVAVTSASFVAGPGEAFHGFGGRRNALDQRGEDFYNWLEEFQQRPDEFESVEELPTADETYQFPTGAQGAYYVQSQFVSSRPYGFLLEQSELSRWRMASDREDTWQASVAAPELSFVVAVGDAPAVIRRLTTLTGRQSLAPRWSRGPGVSRAVESTPTADAQDYADKVRSDLDAIERYDLPLDHFAIEGWPLLEELGVLDEIIDRMRTMGLKPVIYYKAFVGGSEKTERNGVFEEALEKGYVATTPTGQPFLFGSPVEAYAPAALIDFTDPDAVTWWKQRIKEGLDLGAEGFMQDFGEQTFIDMRFDDGSTGLEMHNRYPRLFHQATAEALREYVAEHPEREPWFYVRAGYSGDPGSATFEQTSWGGDNTADWSRASGIGSVIPDMLNRSIGGAYGYATDVGGYVDTFGSISAELLIRWSQLSALIPHHRVHGGPVNGTHMPWNYGSETVEIYRDSIALHISAEPLIENLWREALRTGMPIARPLWLHYPEDAEARAQEQQWLLGPDVLVAPVVEEGATERDVYFPEGCWEHPQRGHRHTGPRTATVDAPIDVLPYYFRCGTRPFQVPAAGQPSTPDPAPGPPGAERTLPATGGGVAVALLVGLGAGARRRKS